MRSDDILKSIKNADKKYIEQSDFDNAKEYFEKRKFKNVLSVIASAAACAALAVFIGINVYNVNKITPETAETASETASDEITEHTEIHGTDNKEKISITTKTYNRSIDDIKAEKTSHISVNSIQSIDYDTEYNSLSYVLSDTENMYKCEKTYTMYTVENSMDSIVKHNGSGHEWVYGAEKGTSFYALKAISDGVVYMKNDGETGFLDADGDLKWKMFFDNGIPTTYIFEYNNELYFVKYYVMEVVYSKENSDIEYSPVKCFVDVVSKEDGKVINTISTALSTYADGSVDISCIGITEQGFLIKLYNNKYTDILALIGFDGEQKLTVSFENDSEYFRITDAAVYDNMLYISGTIRDKKYKDDYGIPKQTAYYFAKSEYFQYGMNFSTEISGAYQKKAQDYNAAEEYNANRSFMMAYSLENEEIRALYTSGCSFGGAVYTDNGKVFWETVKPKISRANILNDAIFFIDEDLRVSKENDVKLTSLEGCANVVEFNSDLEPVNVSQGGICAQLILTYPVRFIK